MAEYTTTSFTNAETTTTTEKGRALFLDRKIMCSNTDSAGAGEDGCAGAGGWCCPTPNKKVVAQNNKRQRVPKRGPGVAELEKILREQEKKTDDDDHPPPPPADGRFPSCFLSGPIVSNTNGQYVHVHDHHHHHRQLQLDHHDHNTSTTVVVLPAPPLYGNNGTTSTSNVNINALLGRSCVGVGDGGGCERYAGGGSGLFLPERALLSVTSTNDSKSNIDEAISISLPHTGFSNESSRSYYCSSSIRQKNQNPTSSMMNSFHPGSASTPSMPLSFGLCHQIEPPSNQRSYQNHPSMGSQDQKTVGMKRPPPPPSGENPAAAGSVCHYQLPPIPSLRHRPDQSASFVHGNIGYNNLNLTKPMLPRDAKWDVPPFEFNHLMNYNTDYGTTDGNFFKFFPTSSSTSPAVLPPFQSLQLQHFSNFDLPFQKGSIKDSNQRLIPAGSDQDKPFYSFLPEKEQMGTKEIPRSLNNIERGTDKDGEEDIDLNLKLSNHN